MRANMEQAMQWYYRSGGTQRGPVNQREIARLTISRNISRETLVWKEGMPEWLPAGKSELAALFTYPPQVSRAPTQTPNHAAAAHRKFYPLPSPSGLNKLWIWAVITTLSGDALHILLGNAMNVLCCTVRLVALVIQCVLLYKLWIPIQDGQARTTPGKAVGFCFIPFFNLYWIFQAFWGLSNDMNAYAANRGIPAPRISEAMGLAICILLYLQLSMLLLGLSPSPFSLVSIILGLIGIILNIIILEAGG